MCVYIYIFIYYVNIKYVYSVHCGVNSVRFIHLKVGSSGLFMLYINLIVELKGHKECLLSAYKDIAKNLLKWLCNLSSCKWYENSSYPMFSTIFSIWNLHFLKNLIIYST